MTNQATITFISNRLSDPDGISHSDKVHIDALIEQYPFFLPARYLAAAYTQKYNTNSYQLLTDIHSYVGNWVLFCRFLENASGKKTIETGQKPDESVQTASYIQEELIAEEDIPGQQEPIMEQEPRDADAEREEMEELLLREQIYNEVITAITPPEEEKLTVDINIAAEEAKFNEEAPIVPVETAHDEPTPSPGIAEQLPGKEDVAAVKKEEQPGTVEDEKQEPVKETIEEREEETILVIKKPKFAIDENVTTPKKETIDTEIPRPVPEPVVKEAIPEVNDSNKEIADDDTLIFPVYTDDYFLQQGIKVSGEIPGTMLELSNKQNEEQHQKALMIMMSFTEWLLHFKNSSEKKKEEEHDQRTLKTLWQKEKLTAAIEEENEEIPESVFELAMNSIAKEDDLASESLADIYLKQGKLDAAIDMYRKLSLQNPQKSTYFARKIEEALK